ncbi:MAG: hypothetical protein ACYC2G_09350 [Gemmatimonadaceae bacterium]
MTRNPGDRLFGMACACGASRPFTVAATALVCDDCGRSLPCATPVMGVEDGPCDCGASTTFVLESTGDLLCTRCGRRRMPAAAGAT